MFGSRQTSSCQGIAAWRYYPWVNWPSDTDNGQLRSVTYKKQRNDTILRVTFHSTLSQYNHDGCSQWYIQFGGQDCTQPAPISTSIYTAHTDISNSWNRAPAEVSGFCNATSMQWQAVTRKHTSFSSCKEMSRLQWQCTHRK